MRQPFGFTAPFSSRRAGGENSTSTSINQPSQVTVLSPYGTLQYSTLIVSPQPSHISTRWIGMPARVDSSSRSHVRCRTTRSLTHPMVECVCSWYDHLVIASLSIIVRRIRHNYSAFDSSCLTCVLGQVSSLLRRRCSQFEIPSRRISVPVMEGAEQVITWPYHRWLV